MDQAADDWRKTYRPKVDYGAYKCISTERRGRVLVVTLNHPPMNSVNKTLHDELTNIFRDVQMDHEADIVVLTGSGEVFSAGGDIPHMQRRIDDPEIFFIKNADMKRMMFGLLDLEKPIICRINGDCVGVGATLALLCDITIAVDTARIGDPHVRVGFVAGDGAMAIWPALIGYARAKEYLLTGDLMSARRAEQIGLINYAVPREELDAKVYGLADRLAKGATKAIKWTKTCINIPLRQLAHGVMDAGLAYQALSNLSADHQEAVTAFQEKRKPKFTGL